MSVPMPTSKAFPPLYLLRAGETCPSCRQGTNVYTLVASALYDEPEQDHFDGPLVLTDIQKLPKRLLTLLAKRCRRYYFDREAPSDIPYLMNHCLRCGAKLTD